MDIEATSITVRWTKPANDGGSPITAYKALILRSNTEIKNRNITDLTAMQLDIGGLTKSTNYTIKLFARNYVFEGKATERKIQTKDQGMKICTKNALRVITIAFSQLINLHIHLFLLIRVTSTWERIFYLTINPPAPTLNIALYLKPGSNNKNNIT